MRTRTPDSQPSEHPLLILGTGAPRSARTRARLLAAAEREGIAVATLARCDRLGALERILAATAADALGVCADAGVQALVASVAAAHDLSYSCIPTGDDDLLARDLGNLTDDPAETLALVRSGRERMVDLAEVNGSVFVNYVAIGLRPRPAGAAAGCGWTERAPDGSHGLDVTGVGAPLLVTNNRFELCREGLAGRGWPDRGLLGVVVFPSGAAEPPAGCRESQCSHLELAASEPVLAEVDGVTRLLQPPLRFRSLPGALLVRVSGSTPALPPPARVRGGRSRAERSQRISRRQIGEGLRLIPFG